MSEKRKVTVPSGRPGSSLTRAPRRQRLPPGGARLRRRLTTLAAPGSPGPYYAYCPLRPGTASATRGTRVSRQQPADELGVDPLDDLVCRGEPLARLRAEHGDAAQARRPGRRDAGLRVLEGEHVGRSDAVAEQR